MDEFLNSKDDDEVEDEEGATRVTVEAAAREGDVARQGTKVKAMDQVVEIHGAVVYVGISAEGTTRKRLQVGETGPSKGSKEKKKKS